MVNTNVIKRNVYNFFVKSILYNFFIITAFKFILKHTLLFDYEENRNLPRFKAPLTICLHSSVYFYATKKRSAQLLNIYRYMACLGTPSKSTLFYLQWNGSLVS